MENLPVMGIVILVYFIAIHYIRYLENNAQRKHELDIEKLRLSNKFVVAPFISYLLSDLLNDTSDQDNENVNRLIGVLKSMLLNYSGDNQDLVQLNNDKNNLKEILENGNLATDIVLKVKQLLDFMQ